jgi:putative nucleotidyltransferase with HDIG domain
MAAVYGRRTVSLLSAVGVACAVFIAVNLWLTTFIPVELVLLPWLALFAEFLPVQLRRRGVRVTFALPYVAGMALIAGPLAAVVLEIIVSGSAGVVRAGGRPAMLRWVAANTLIAAGCAAGASLVMAGVHGHPALKALVFTGTYTAVNLLLVCALDYLSSGRRLSSRLLGGIQVGTRASVLYSVIAMAVCVLLVEGLSPLLVLTLLPVFLLRGLIAVQERGYEHYYDTITALTLMLDRTHPYTHGHLERVSRVAEEVALSLGLAPERARLVREAAVLHDIGKIAVDEEILDAPRKLTSEEMEHVRRHCSLGAEILAQVPQFVEVSKWILHHHERPDGAGYPYGLEREQIPIESRIIAVADAYDAMTGGDLPAERRSYKEPMTKAEALAELNRCAGSQFDPGVVRAFQEVLSAGGK